ncbi:MAG: aminoglycoside phosphotransferase family protein, partial [Polyangiaceae bacterium]
MVHAPLPNPEARWEPPAAVRVVTALDIEQRIGAFEGQFTLLEGGLSNLNVLVDGRLLRIYRREVNAVHLEAALLRQPWSSFRVPKLLSTGEDFLLLEHVTHGPLLGSQEHGAAVGAALAEIHSRSFAQAGLLGPELAVTSPFEDLIRALTEYASSNLERIPTGLDAALAERMLRTLTDNAAALREVAGPPVLLHADFKVSNLHWTPEQQLLVLDWEFAYAGSHL